MEITSQCVVALTWTLKDTLGEELDVLDDPVEFLVGGNDLLQGLDVRQTRANLTAIVRKLKARPIGVLITGQKAPRAIGAAYARDFDASFAQVAAAERVGLPCRRGRELSRGDRRWPGTAWSQVW